MRRTPPPPPLPPSYNIVIDFQHFISLRAVSPGAPRIDCKTVGFFLKISKEFCFQPHSRYFVWLLARTWICKNTDCFAVYAQDGSLADWHFSANLLLSLETVILIRHFYDTTWSVRWTNWNEIVRVFTNNTTRRVKGWQPSEVTRIKD